MRERNLPEEVLGAQSICLCPEEELASLEVGLPFKPFEYE
jgi:hypothetical protein